MVRAGAGAVEFMVHRGDAQHLLESGIGSCDKVSGLLLMRASGSDRLKKEIVCLVRFRYAFAVKLLWLSLLLLFEVHRSVRREEEIWRNNFR